MKINHNMSAVIANNRLLANETKLQTSVERLSTGYKINSAGDNPAGIAISRRMKAQIEGLDQASQNASDGMSCIGTAEGALTEVTNMIQRVRELAVQAANDVYTEGDIDAIQLEIEAIKDEVDRISTDTEFNTTTLLDGSLSRRVYGDAKAVSAVDVSSSVEAGMYDLTIESDPRQAVLIGNSSATGDVPSGTVTINGVMVEITGEESSAELYLKLREGAEKGETNLIAVENGALTPAYDLTQPNAVIEENAKNAGYTPSVYEPGSTQLVFITDDYGTGAELSVTCDDADLANYLGIPMDVTVTGNDAQVSLSTTDADTGETSTDFSTQATVTVDGNKISVTDRNGFSIEFNISAGYSDTTFTDFTATAGTSYDAVQKSTAVLAAEGTEVSLNVTDIGMMTLHIGANAYQTVDVDIPEVSTSSLGIENLNVTTVRGAEKAIDAADLALQKVTNVRAQLGAYENRLDYAVSSLDQTSENMTAALSRVEDVDMAEEMTTYTSLNVLTQAATSVLGQANDLPEQVLQLLQ